MLETVERLEATLGSMHRLERHLGHFYNWYGTLDLRPLEPEYISSVDSGNLAGHLITLWNACGEMTVRPVIEANWHAGIEDPLELLREALCDIGTDTALSHRRQLTDTLDVLAVMLRPAPSTPVGVVAQLSALALHAEKIPDLLRGLPADDPKTAARTAEAVMWADGLCAAVVGHLRSVATLMPWAVLLASDTKGALANTELARS